MDRNTVIGFVLLGLLLFIYLFINTKSSHELEAQRKRAEDSIALVKAKQDAAAHSRDTVKTVVMAGPDTASGFNKASRGAEQLTTVENEVIKVVFSNKGGQPVEVSLKKFNAYDSTPVKVIAPGTENRLMYSINTGPNMTANIADLYFDSAQVIKNPDGSQTISYHLPTPAGESLVHQFTIRPNDYMVDWNVAIGNPAGVVLSE